MLSIMLLVESVLGAGGLGVFAEGKTSSVLGSEKSEPARDTVPADDAETLGCVSSNDGSVGTCVNCLCRADFRASSCCCFIVTCCNKDERGSS